MGIRKWFIKRGLGGIGDSARTIYNVYKSVKETNPELEEEGVFFLTLKLRREHVKKLIKPELQFFAITEQIKKDVQGAQGDLATLIFQELHYEYPILREVEINDNDLYNETKEIVQEIVET